MRGMGVLFLLTLVPLLAASDLTDLHTQAQQQPVAVRIDTLYDLAIAATAVDRQLSAKWALEMYRLATDDTTMEPMNHAAQRKNALTVLSLTDPEEAARHFLELEPSPAHAPMEDPRIDLSRHLFPKLWAEQGVKSLPTIRKFAEYTSEHGQYPYVAMGQVLPLIAKVDPEAAHALFDAAVRRLSVERNIVRTQTDFLKFLKETWPMLSKTERSTALEVAFASIPHKTNNLHWHIEYYTSAGTVRFESEEVSRVHDLLPMVHEFDPAWEKRLRKQYPALVDAPLDANAWRAGAAAVAPERDKPELIQAALEKHYLIMLPKWFAEDPKRATDIALGIKDTSRRLMALALIGQKPEWQGPADTLEHLRFLVALTPKTKESATEAMRIGRQLGALEEMHQLAMVYPDAEFIRRECGDDLSLRTSLLAAAARGSLRNAPGYEEPN